MVLFLFVTWEQRKLGEMVNEVTRTDPESNAPIMMITANNGFIEQSDRYAFDNAGESLKKYILLEKGELAYNHGASKLRPYGSCFALTTVEKARIPFVYHCFSAKNQNSEFLSIELNSDNVEKQLRRIVSSGARMDGLLNISFTEYSTVELSLPKTEEQDKISYCFRMFDNLITLHQRKEFLSDCYSDIFNAEDKSKKVANAWEQRKLREVFDYERPDTYIVKSDKYSDTYSTPVLTANKGFILGYTNEMQVCNKECIIFDDFTLDSKYVTFPFMVKSSALKILTAKIGYFLPFAYQLLQATNIEILGHARHYISVVQPTKVLIPSNDEQIRIGKCIQQIDNLITLHQRKYDKIVNIKKALLEKMFPSDAETTPKIRFKGFTDAWEQRKAETLFISYAEKG